MNEAVKFIKSLKIGEESVVLACSYGPDSMVLLDLLQKENLNIIVAHVNHKLRTESDDEEIKLKEYCLQNNLILEDMCINEYPKGNTEMNARVIRYKFFEQVLKKYNSKYLFTAHHGDDLIETVLMRLTRGASFKGYAGFTDKNKQNNYEIVRPLIYTTKEDIILYAENNHISYAIDYTNKENKYTRNRIRHNVLPELKKENKNVHKKFVKFSKLINEYEEFFNRETSIIFQRLYLNNKIDLNEFYLLEDLLKKRLLDKILFEIYEEDINIISDVHTDLIMNLVESDKQNSFVILPKNIKITKFYNILEFNYHENISTSYNYTLKNEVDLELGKISKVKSSDILKSNNLIRLDSKEIKLPIFVRTRKIGDKIEVKNLGGSKKINDILIDNKISTKKRDIYPIVTDSDDKILWIPGLKKSKLDKQKSESYDIILKYEKKGEENEK